MHSLATLTLKMSVAQSALFNLEIIGLTPLFRDHRGFMPPQLKTTFKYVVIMLHFDFGSALMSVAQMSALLSLLHGIDI